MKTNKFCFLSDGTVNQAEKAVDGVDGIILNFLVNIMISEFYSLLTLFWMLYIFASNFSQASSSKMLNFCYQK